MFVNEVLMLLLMVIYALDDPLQDSTNNFEQVIFIIDISIWGFFILELAIRIAIMAMIDGIQAYHLLSIVFDGIILLLGFFYYIGYSQLSFSRILRTFKIIVVISKIKFVERIVKCLALSIKPILAIYLYLVVFYICFAVAFVRYWSG